MAAKFLAFDNDPDGVRLAISEIKGYKPAYSGTGTLIYLKERKDGDYMPVDETVEEIDEMLLRAEHSTAAVVRKTDVEKWRTDITAPAAGAHYTPPEHDERWAEMVNAIIAGERKAKLGESEIIKVEDDETLAGATVPAIRVVTRGGTVRPSKEKGEKIVTRFAIVEKNSIPTNGSTEKAIKKIFRLVFDEDYDAVKGPVIQGIRASVEDAAFLVACYHKIVRSEGK
jgi:hypothetical protein